MAYISKSKQLAKMFGGVWKYDFHTTWWCNDNNRHIVRTSPGVDEFDNNLGPPIYYLYEKDKAPIRLSSFTKPLIFEI